MKKVERQKIVSNIFNTLCPNWMGARMCFVIERGKVLKIEGRDVIGLIDKKMKKLYEKT